jgi:hypothetical protein
MMEEGADRRPPGPVNRQALEAVLHPIGRAGDVRGGDTDERADQRIERQCFTVGLRDAADGEVSTGAAEDDTHRHGRHSRQRHRNERARAILEEQQLDGEQHGGDRAAEGRRHARGGAGGEQRLPLVGAHVHELTHQRADRAARGDDRPFGTEGSAGADRHGGRERLQDHDARRDAALAIQHPFHHLRDAVAANGRGTVASHDADDQRPDHGNDEYPGADLRRAGRARHEG